MVMGKVLTLKIKKEFSPSSKAGRSQKTESAKDWMPLRRPKIQTQTQILNCTPEKRPMPQVLALVLGKGSLQFDELKHGNGRDVAA
jgi:hypothetical protein